MIVDTSAMLAILLKEEEEGPFKSLMAKASDPSMSAGSLVELQAVLIGRFRGILDDEAEALLSLYRIAIAPVTAEHVVIARDAYRRYGLGTGHPARLNFGDCFAYALAKATGEPLLFTGEAFALTDVTIAAP